MSAEPPAILIMHPGSLGDLLLATSAMRAVRKAWPGHDLVALVRGEAGRLLEACGEVRQVLPLEGPALAQLFARGPAIPPSLAAVLRRCTAAVCWLADREDLLRTALRGAGIRKVIVQSPHAPALRSVHMADRYMETLRPWGISKADPPVLHLPSAPGDPEAIGCRRVTIVVHPGSGSPLKCMEGGRLASAMNAVCYGTARALLVLGGPADDTTVADFRRHLRGEPVMMLHRDLITVAAVLRIATVFVGHDSGLTHLAAMLGVPTIALFGPTDPARWAPRGPSVMVLRGAPCSCEWGAVPSCRRPCLDVPTEQIVAAVQQCLAARPAPDLGLPCSEQVC
jgi:ADP-heptose:LPS heptosyltransferase